MTLQGLTGMQQETTGERTLHFHRADAAGSGVADPGAVAQGRDKATLFSRDFQDRLSGSRLNVLAIDVEGDFLSVNLSIGSGGASCVTYSMSIRTYSLCT
jgi:hypothetical protein